LAAFLVGFLTAFLAPQQLQAIFVVVINNTVIITVLEKLKKL
jgi:hypothetical protein